MRSNIYAVLSFGLINVPVGIATSAKRDDPAFRTLHAKCGTRISMKKWCPACDTEVHADDTMKGFEVAKDKFIHLTDEEIDAAKGERSKVIHLSSFVRDGDVDPLFIERTYFLVPSKEKAVAGGYKLLMAAMGKLGLAGIGKAQLWGKQYPVLVRFHPDGALTMSMLFLREELRPHDTIPKLLDGVEVREADMNMAAELLNMLTRPFDPARDLTSDTRDSVTALIEAKVAGEEYVVMEQPQPDVTIDVQEMLRASIDRLREEVKA